MWCWQMSAVFHDQMGAFHWHDLEVEVNQKNRSDILSPMMERGKTEGNRNLEGLQDTPFEALRAEVEPSSGNMTMHCETEWSQVYHQSLLYLRPRLLDY